MFPAAGPSVSCSSHLLSGGTTPYSHHPFPLAGLWGLEGRCPILPQHIHADTAEHALYALVCATPEISCACQDREREAGFTGAAYPANGGERDLARPGYDMQNNCASHQHDFLHYPSIPFWYGTGERTNCLESGRELDMQAGRLR